MNPTNEFWPELTHTWNPMYGCKRGCVYCYARRLHTKRAIAKKMGKKLSKRYDKPFDEIQYFPEDLMKIPKKSRVIKKVFVCNMGDICYQEHKNIELVLGVCKRRQEMTFMFLTKDPTVYERHNWPSNCQLGVTITGDESYKTQWDRLAIIEKLPNYTFISYEPMAGIFLYTPHECVNMIIVGADSRKHNPIVPEKEWIDRVKEFEKTHNVHYKYNIKKYL